MDDLLELAERCETATGLDRELDVELAVVAGLIHEPEFERGYFYGAGNNCDYVLERGDYDHGNNAPELPHYTASLDAAMTLVLEDGAYPQISKATPSAWRVNIGFGNRAKGVNSKAATPALALCAAALRARAAL